MSDGLIPALVERLKAKFKAEDERAIEMMAAGNLVNFAEYRYSAGYRKALRDVNMLVDETLEEIMKE